MRLPPFTITVIAPVAFVLVLAFATHGTGRVDASKSAAPPPEIVAADDGQQRNVALEQLRLAMAEPQAVKGDRLAPPTPLADRILVPPPVAEVTEATEDAPRVARRHRVVKREKKRSRDVCRQHGQRKVFVGKYRWRCRK